MRRRVVLIFGMAGMGKTHLAKRLVSTHRRVVILDPLHEFEGDVVVFTFDEYLNVMERVHGLSHFRIVCRFSEDFDVQWFFRLTRDLRNILLVIDEAEIFLDARSMDENFSWIVNYGRHRELSILAVARRSPELSVRLRAQATSIVTFAQTEPRDLKNLEAYGFDPESVKQLPPRQFLFIGEPPEKHRGASAHAPKSESEREAVRGRSQV